MKSNLLKAERVRYNLTQKEISKILNIDVTSYSKRETGVMDFKSSEINLLKHLLKLTPEKIDEIFFESELENNSIKIVTA